jgi:GNAT superfamily N-acetyltransferase
MIRLNMDYRVIEIKEKSEIKRFIRFPETIYYGDANWVPPLYVAEEGRFDPEKNPFYSYGQVNLFVVIDSSGSWLGRIACFINPFYNQKFKVNHAFFGFFESVNNVEVSKLLFQTIAKLLIERGIADVLGPVNFTTNEEAGLLVTGFDKHPTFMTNYAPAYYADLLEKCGLVKETDLFAFEWNSAYSFPESLVRVHNRMVRNDKIKIRILDRKKFGHELVILREMYNQSFEDVWGFVPMSEKEFNDMGNSLVSFADFDMILIAEYDNKPVGFCISLPDVNIIIKKIKGKLYPVGIIKFLYLKSKLKSLRLNVLGVIKEYRKYGIAAMLIHELARRGKMYGFEKCELSIVIEKNVEMITLMKRLEFNPTKVYRIYKSSIQDLLSKQNM